MLYFRKLTLSLFVLVTIYSCQDDPLDNGVASIVITPQVDEVVLYPNTPNIKKFNGKAFNDQKDELNDAIINWMSSDSDLAVIADSGETTFVGYGLVTISAISGDVKEDMEIDIVEPPSLSFTSDPPTSIGYNQVYTYTPSARSFDGEVDFDANLPSWLNYESETNTITGIPGWRNLNRSFDVMLKASNDITSVAQSFSLTIELVEINCDEEFGDPAQSLYILPYKVGESYRMWQSYCHPEWSHKNWFSYDFEMPMGTEIIASRAGTVIFERDSFEDGTRVSGEENFIFIQHNDGTVVHYIHLMKNGSLVNVGQTVEQGEVIGLSGDSGGSAGPHLHTTQFMGRTSFDRQYSIPMNYSNMNGPVNEKNGLVIDEHYEALPY